MMYVARLLESVNALEEFGVLPLPGGYLNQPVTLIRDIQVIRELLRERRAKSLEAAQAIRSAMASTQVGAPLPEIPEELLSGSK